VRWYHHNQCCRVRAPCGDRWDAISRSGPTGWLVAGEPEGRWLPKVIHTAIEGVRLVTTERLEDARGFFSETFSADAFAAGGVPFDSVQDNHVYSRQPFTLRGIHYQLAPVAQAKLVRVIRGSALDVAIDVRRGSPTFGRCVTALLSRENWMQMYIPESFAHAILSLEPDTEFIYKVSSPYSPEHARGVRFDDPDVAVPWGVPSDRIIVNPRDMELPFLRDQADLPGMAAR
jgi:dTDP-4-dehydrorhamnose 3,5-epimerase